MLANKVRCSLTKRILIKGLKYNSLVLFRNFFVRGRGAVGQRRKDRKGTFGCRGFMQKNAMKALTLAEKRRKEFYTRDKFKHKQQ